MTVNLGTSAQDTAITNLAPCLAMPPSSACLPTINPVMFCKKSSGIFRFAHSSTKCAPFCADSENKIPLLATIPISCPSIRANPQTSVVPNNALNSSKSESSISLAITSRTSNERRKSRLTMPYSSSASYFGNVAWCLSCDVSCDGDS